MMLVMCNNCGHEFATKSEAQAKRIHTQINGNGLLTLKTALEQIQQRCMSCVTNKECSQAVLDIDSIARKALGTEIKGYLSHAPTYNALHAQVGKLKEACKKALTCASLNSDVRALIVAVLAESKEE